MSRPDLDSMREKNTPADDHSAAAAAAGASCEQAVPTDGRGPAPMPEAARPLKIAMIGHKRVPGREGGVEVVVEELAGRMAAAGHSVTLYNRAAKGMPRHKEYAGARIITVPTINKKSLDAVIYSFFATLHAIFGRYDLIHYHALGPSVMLALAHLFGRRTAATVHGLDWQRGKWGGFGSWYLKLGEKVIARYADEVIVLSEGVQQYFRETYGRETVFIPNGVAAPMPAPPALITEKWGLAGGDYILFLARVVPEKGLHYLLEAYRGIKTDKRLVVAGGDSHSGDYWPMIQKMAAEDPRVILAGFAAGQLKAELLANAALYVLPSDIEGMPISLLEAMRCGLPCLTSDIPENTQLLGGFGASFAKGDVAALRVGLEKALESPPPAGEAQAEMIRAHYDWGEVARATLALYHKAAERS